MSSAGNDPRMIAAALQGQRPQGAPPPQQQGQQPQQGARPPTPPGAQEGGFGQLLQAYQRCEQTGNCSPQDLQVLQQGLPHLQQLMQNIQKIIQVAGQAHGAQPQQGQQPQGQPQAQ